MCRSRAVASANLLRCCKAARATTFAIRRSMASTCAGSGSGDRTHDAAAPQRFREQVQPIESGVRGHAPISDQQARSCQRPSRSSTVPRSSLGVAPPHSSIFAVPRQSQPPENRTWRTSAPLLSRANARHRTRCPSALHSPPSSQGEWLKSRPGHSTGRCRARISRRARLSRWVYVSDGLGERREHDEAR